MLGPRPRGRGFAPGGCSGCLGWVVSLLQAEGGDARSRALSLGSRAPLKGG